MTNTSFTPQEIEQFLQQFFDVVGARQYIGARYVPIFGRAGSDTVEWDELAPYEPLTVVMHDGVSYVSRRYVPTGIEISDTDYWVETYRFNAQVEQYRQEVLGFQDQIDNRIPFPDPHFYPRYGEPGQVLETLTDGTVKWSDPVVPSDEQAEEVITQWLDDHPEATTTVQDGSITDPKLADASTVIRFRYNIGPSVTRLATINKAGIYNITPAVFDNLTDLPTNAQRGVYTLICIPYNTTNNYQLLIKADSVWSQMFERTIIGDTANAWEQIRPTLTSGLANSSVTEAKIADGSVTDAKIADSSTILRFRNNIASSVTQLSTINKSGSYNITPTVFDNLTDLPTNAQRGVYTLICIPYNATNNYQLLIKADSAWSQMFERTIIGDTANAWEQIRPTLTSGLANESVTTAKIADGTVTPSKLSFIPNVLTGKKIVTAGDSFTAAVYNDASLDGKNYGYYVAQRYNMEFVNAGINGSTMALSKNHVDNPTDYPITDRNPFCYQRYLQIPNDTDILTIWFGINDRGNCYLGTINDTTNDTFYGAWNNVLEYYLTNRPFMHIGLISWAYDSSSFSDAVKEIGAKWGYPVWCLYDDPNIPGFFRNTNMSQTAMQLRSNAFVSTAFPNHPNPEWHKFISGAYEHFIKGL